MEKLLISSFSGVVGIVLTLAIQYYFTPHSAPSVIESASPSSLTIQPVESQVSNVTHSSTTEPSASSSPITEPTFIAVETDDGLWKDNLLKADFKVLDYRFCSYLGYTYSSIHSAEHVIFVDTLKWLQDARTHCAGYDGDREVAAWDVSEAQDGSVWAWFMTGHLSDSTSSCGGKCSYILCIGAEGGINASLACARMFANCTNLKHISFRGCLHTDGATSMEEMFYNCKSLQEVDTTSFNTSSVTNMSKMFYGINNSCKIEINLSLYDTSNVTEFDNFMYYGDKVNGIPWPNLFK